jgi:BolA protein
MSERIDMIRERLTAALAPDQLDIIDESHLHAGHPGARSGGGHFNVTIVSSAFEGENLLARHRMVYDALGDAMKTEIHALSIKALTPKK